MAERGPPLLEARDLARHYPVSRGPFRRAATLRALDGVSLRLDAGETLAVVGESGCGKSTLARQLALVEPPSAGSLALEGLDLARSGRQERRRARRSIQMVFQNPYASLNPRKRIGAILAEPLVASTRLTARERDARVLAMMERVGLAQDQRRRYPHMFSGGQRQRIAIARALMLEPRVVIADEPVSALDVSIQAQVLNLLADLQRALGVAYVFISHDLGVVRHVARRVIVMYLGRVVEHGARDALFRRPTHPYTQALLAAMPRIDRGGEAAPALAGELPSPLDPPSGCAFRTRCPHADPRCARERPELRPVGDQQVACHHAERIAAERQAGARPAG